MLLVKNWKQVKLKTSPANKKALVSMGMQCPNDMLGPELN